tara:strand:- start:30953 stop:31876 length:924 start_codon:yes stop_codon:yes gene_type:complete
MKKRVILLSILASVFSLNAQSKLEKDKIAIRKMEGCYKVEFRYAEVFSNDTLYKYPEREYSWSYEWITEIPNDDPNKVELQHLLSINDSSVVKHWRQEWIYENTDANVFHKDYTWNYEQWKEDKVKGEWTQRVSQVDDSPRYIASGAWVHPNHSGSYWESIADAPLPRREKKAGRKDYNVLQRVNRQELTDFGWAHKQENTKVLKSFNGARKDIALETGYNTYTKTDEINCKPSKEYWEQTNAFWHLVREEWITIYGQKKDFKVAVMGKDGFFYAKMFEAAKESGNWSEKKKRNWIKKTIAEHVTWM